MVKELHKRGYGLGVISNTTSREAVPRDLVTYGVAEYFPVVILSTTCGHRKPGTRIFETAANQLGVAVDQCAYVGDRPSRNVLGSKRSGFPVSVLIHDDYVKVREPVEDYQAPDYTIGALSELLDIL